MQLITFAQIFPTLLFLSCVTLTVQIRNTSIPQGERMRYYIKVTASQIHHHMWVVLIGAFSFPLSGIHLGLFMCVF